MSKVDREFYSLISIIHPPGTIMDDRFYEAIDELKHAWRSYHERD